MVIPSIKDMMIDIQKNKNTTNAQLSIIRESIDEIDNDICNLLYKRSEIIHNLVEIKKSLNLNTFDPKRESTLIKERLKKCPKSWSETGYIHLWREIISCGLLQQNKSWLLKIDTSIDSCMYSLVRSYVGMGMNIESLNSAAKNISLWQEISISKNTMLAIQGKTLFRLGIPPADLQVFKIFISSSPNTTDSGNKLIIEDGSKIKSINSENVCFLITNRFIIDKNIKWNYKILINNYDINATNEKFKCIKISNHILNTDSNTDIDIGGIDSI